MSSLLFQGRVAIAISKNTAAKLERIAKIWGLSPSEFASRILSTVVDETESRSNAVLPRWSGAYESATPSVSAGELAEIRKELFSLISSTC